MLETIPSAALLGLEAYRVRVEVALTRGTPTIQVVGLPQNAVREGKERIRAAALEAGLRVPGPGGSLGRAVADGWPVRGRPTWRRWWPCCGARGS